MTPEEGAQLYQAPEFATIKAEADDYVAVSDFGLPASVPRRSINHGHQFIEESARAIEIVSATYFALKHGAHGGDANAPELAPYLNKASELWRDIAHWGPVYLWTESGSSNLDSENRGWREGDIALRSWLPGAFVSYDAIRDDLSAADSAEIDTWLSDLQDTMWNSPPLYDVNHNRGSCRFAIAHVLA
ncbi:MAG: hypothetical protein EA353_14850, partial [Puniceicoccaceae bacterium]